MSAEERGRVGCVVGCDPVGIPAQFPAPLEDQALRA